MTKEKLKYDYTTVNVNPITDVRFGSRHIQVLLVFICLACGYMMRVDINVAIIAMTDRNSSNIVVDIFHWNKKTQDLILSSFFWGYTVMQIPAGQLAQRYGAKPLLFVAMFVNGIISLLTPILIHVGGWKLTVVCRVIQGLTQACFFPCINHLVSKWIPNNERSRLSNLIFTGTPCGTIVGTAVSGLLAHSFGWPSVFYTLGAFGIFISILWYFYGASSPANHATISDAEKNYIETSLGHNEEQKVMRTPWKSILTSLPVVAIIITHTGCNWGFLTLLVQTPSYMKSALGIDLKRSGLLSTLPYIAMWIGSLILSFMSDYIVNNGICSAGFARKLFNTIGTWVPALGLIALCFVPRGHEYIAVGLITFTVGLSSGMNAGYMLNHIDLSPNFAGALMGLTNCVANAIACLGPILVGYIVKDENDPVQWRLVFCIASGVYFLTNLFFLIFGSSMKQSWNDENIFGDIEMKYSNVIPPMEVDAMIPQNINKNRNQETA